MSDTTRCSQCRTLGWRRRGTLAPENWLFLEAQDDETDEITVIWACTERCALTLWKHGPGTLDLNDPDTSRKRCVNAEPVFEDRSPQKR